MGKAPAIPSLKEDFMVILYIKCLDSSSPEGRGRAQEVGPEDLIWSNKRKCCTWVRATPIINPGWGMKIESNPANLVPKQTCCWPKFSPLAMAAEPRARHVRKDKKLLRTAMRNMQEKGSIDAEISKEEDGEAL